MYAQYVNCRIFLPSSLASNEVSLFGTNFEEVNGEPYYVLTKNNTRRDILQVSENTKTEGMSWFDPILPSLSHIWRWELPKDFEIEKLGRGETIIWNVFADNAPARSGKVQISQIEYVKKAESIFKFVQVAIQQNQFLFFVFILLILYILYKFLKG